MLVKVISLVLLTMAVMLITLISGIETFFSNTSMEMIVFNLKLCRYLKIGTSSIILWFIVIAILIVFLIWCFEKCLLQKQSSKTQVLISSSLLILAVIFFDYKYHLFDYLRYMTTDSQLYQTYYKNPQDAEIRFSNSKKNLIVLYMESIENSYHNSQAFGEDLLPRIGTLNKKYGKLGGYKQVVGTGWTMGGVVATSCSIPLTANLFPGAESINYGAVPKAVCLQDILGEHGYDLYMIAGTANDFAGMKEFLNAHGVEKQNIYDWHYFKRKYGAEVKGNLWGAKDSVMLKEAQKIITKAAEKGPFFMTINMVDSHMAKGYVDDICAKDFGDYRDVVKCSDYQVGGFVDWFEKQKFQTDTILLIIGDHLMMDEYIVNKYLKQDGDAREASVLLMGVDKKQFDTKKVFSAFDIMPTLLDAIGAEWNSKKLGLGCSLLGHGEATLIEKLGKEKLNDELMKRNELYDVFVDDN